MRDPESELEEIRAAGLLRRMRTLEPLPGGKIRTGEGSTLVNFSSNDYLGLATSEELRETMSKAARDLGSGSGASRLICGTHPAHRELEERLAEFKGTPAALAFSSGFAAAVGTLNALLQKGDTVILDKLCHASLVDGARLSGATVRIFPHNHLDKLERLLRNARDHETPGSRILVVTESVFSMDGDRATLEEIVDLKDRFGALILLDEAHAFGILGKKGGRGLADELGLAARIDLFLGTLSKAAGVSGGFIAADRPMVDLLTNRARSLIYTTAPPPAVAATATRAIEILGSENGDQRRVQLWKNLHQFTRLVSADCAPASAIIPRIIGDEARAMEVSKSLQDAGYLVAAVRFPTVAKGKARLRITLSSEHSTRQIDSLAKALSTA